jgi:NAD(P)-dependent dehydrogenase (short-subunit alcohol dehydrogenase family)
MVSLPVFKSPQLCTITSLEFSKLPPVVLSSEVMSRRLENKVAIVTGGGHGYGAGIVARFIAEGAKVVIADLSVQNGTKVAKEQGCAFAAADVTKRADWEAVLKTAIDTYGGIDIVVNNAGACYPNKVNGHQVYVCFTSVRD